MANNQFKPVVTHSRCARQAAAVTPSDTVDLVAFAYFGLYIGVGGAGKDIKVDMVETGTAIVFKNVPTGYLNIQVRRVYSTGTSATDIVALL